MKRNKWFYATLIIIASVLIIKLLLYAIIDPWVTLKVVARLNENESSIFNIKKTHIQLLSSGIELDSISIASKTSSDKELNINGQIASVKIKGFNILKALFNKKIDIKSVTISYCSINCKIPFIKDSHKPIIIPRDIKIDRIIFDKTNLAIVSASNSEAYSIDDGEIKVYNIHLIKEDTLSRKIISKIDFKAGELKSVTTDSMYSFRLLGLDYSSTSKSLTADTISVHPNYSNYGFTSRYKFQKTRIEALFSEFSATGFDAGNYLATGNLVSSNAEIGNMQLNVFRDKRKEFNHKKKPLFQDIIYNYPGILHIDSLEIKDGAILYTEHAEKANDPGSLSFDRVKAKVYMIANDMLKDSENTMLKLQTEALLMKKGKLSILLKVKLNNPDKIFTVDGMLTDLDAKELNPFLEKTAFIYATSGHIDTMKFNFKADINNAKGKLTLSYAGLDIAVKNKQTDDTTALKERFLSRIVNIKIMDSNPSPGQDLRSGIIEYERDPERFLFSYCAKSIMSGVRSSLVRDSKKD